VPYEVRASEVVYDGALSRVRVDAVGMPDGEVVEREVVEHPDAVAVVPVEEDGSVLLVRQYRHPVGDHVLEIPAGKLDLEGEEPQRAARRELIEEAGVEARSLTWLATFHNSSGWTDESTTVYLATGLRHVPPPDDFHPHAEEADMDVVRLPLAEAVALARRGELPDAKTLIGVLLAEDHLSRGDGAAWT
jgi:8-oxo-dGDP phosphatase